MSELHSEYALLHVLVATNAVEGGGAQRSNLILATGLADLGFQVSVLSVRPPDANWVETLPPSIRLSVIGETRWPQWSRAFSVLRWTLRYCREENVNIIISGSFGLNQVLLVARVARILHIPLIAVERLGIRYRLDVLGREGSIRRRIFHLLLAEVYRRADHIVAVSEGVAEEFKAELRLQARKIDVVQNGLDVAEIRRQCRQRPDVPFSTIFETMARPRIVSVGRLEEQKAHDDLIRSFMLIRKTHGGSLTILGEGSLRGYLKGLVDEFGLDDSVQLPGHISPAYWYIAHSDVFVLSSRAEGYPLVLIEALACRTPVVSTDCPSGPQEILKGTGMENFAPVGDPESLRKVIVRVLDTPGVSQSDLSRFSHHEPPQRFARIVRSLTTNEHVL